MSTLFPDIEHNYKWVPAVITYQPCEACGDEIPAHELNKQSHMCSECHTENHTDCDDCGISVPNNNVEIGDDNDYCPSCYEERCTCSDCGKICSSPDRLEEDDNGNRFCEKCQYNTLSLRPRRNKVYSNAGCEAPVWDVQKTIHHLLFLMKRCNKRTEEWSPHTKMWWGEYQIDSIDCNGALHIGCHKFKIEEIERFISEDLDGL